MNKIQDFIKSQCSNWQKNELIWLFFATAVILGLSIYWEESLVGIVSAITGVFCVVLVGKGKISNYFFGVITVTTYAFIAYEARYYGDAMLNLCYYLPMNFIGLFVWSKNMKKGSGEVLKIRMSAKTNMLIFGGSGVAVIGYSFFLRSLGGSLPILDSISTVFSIVAQLLCVMRAAEQWIFWIIVNVVSVIMWGIAFSQESDGIATLLMWCVYLVNAVIMWISWNKETKAVSAPMETGSV